MSEQILPFYVVCDESYSMSDHIDDLNSGLADLHHAIGTDPVVADKTRFSLIGFSSDAEILLPLCDLSDITEMSGLTAKNATSFGKAFDLLRTTIERDVDMLKGDGHLVYRPAVFFLSDGQPTDSQWEASFARLVDPAWKPRPNIIAFGIGSADAATIGRIGTFKSFMSTDNISTGAALHEFARALTKSIVQSGSSMARGDGEVTLQVPDKIPGFTELKVDPL